MRPAPIAIAYVSPPPTAAAYDPARDRALVERVRAGDKHAEELLYRAHARAVSVLAARLLGYSDEAQDVVQDVFLRALARLSQLRDGALLRAWLLRITVNEVQRRYRRRKLLRALGIVQASADSTLCELASPGMSVEERAELAELDRLLAKLPARERIAWMLRHVEGYELAEIAQACGASLASVKRWIERAHSQLRAHLDVEIAP